MARKTKSEIHQEARAMFDRIESSVRDERIQCQEDRRFYSIAGAQWEGPLGEQFENKPKLEVNKIHLSVLRIINEYRNNRITVDFQSDDDQELADLCDGLYRACEQRSAAQEAYDTAFEEAVGGGMGAWRLTSQYKDEEDEDDDQQEICIEPISDADKTVFWDLNAKRKDKRDAKHCFVLHSLTPDEYEETYNDSPASWPEPIGEYTGFDWNTPDVVWVAEYYKVEMVKDKVAVYTSLTGEKTKLRESDENYDEELERLIATGHELTRTKTIKRRKVRKYIMSGGKILEDCGHIAGKWIPIVPVYGKRWFIDNIERAMGHVRLSKDAQRLKNMQLSALAETAALSPREKPILAPEQIDGYQHMWETDNINNHAYLLLNPLTDLNGQELPSGPLGYTKPPSIPPAMAALLQITEEDMKDLLGSRRDGQEMFGQISTDTAELIQNNLDMQTYIYMSNMADAVKRSGEIYLEMAKDVYVETGRRERTVNSAGESSYVDMNTPKLDDSKRDYIANSLQDAKMDLAVDVGPASSTRKAALVRRLINMLPMVQDPETHGILVSMILSNTEGEGMGDIRQFFRKRLVAMGVIPPNEQEKAELEAAKAAQQPSANDQYLQAAAQKEAAYAQEAMADTALKQAKADEVQAKIIEILAGVSQREQELAIEAANKLREQNNVPTQ